MALPMKPLPENPEFAELVRKSIEAFEALPLEQRREHRRAQAKSWAIGELMLAYPEMTREDAERIYETATL